MKNARYALQHVKYNREVIYSSIKLVKVEDFVEMVDKQFDEVDLDYFVYHNPTVKYVAGERIHPTGRIEQILTDKNFLIELV